MPRSDGNFPHYNRLDVDSELWPDKYWDSCCKCIKCDNRWPNTHLFRPTPCCNQPPQVLQEPPDMRWPEAIHRLNSLRFENLYDKWNEGIEDEELEWEDIKTGGKVDPRKIDSAIDELINEVSNDSPSSEETRPSSTTRF